MDDLAAAAAVLAMEVDSDAEDDMEQEVDAGEHGGDLLESGAEQLRTANKENDTGFPDSRVFGAAHKQVSPDHLNLRATPPDLSDTRCHLPIPQLDRQARRDLRAGAMAPALILMPRTSSTASGDFIGSR